MAQLARYQTPLITPLQQCMLELPAVAAIALFALPLVAPPAIPITARITGNQQGESDSGKKFFLSAKVNSVVLITARTTQLTISGGASR